MADEPAPDQIPPNVRHFLKTRIETVGLLEVLLFLHAHPDRDWTIAAINEELRSNLSSVSFRLERLKSLGLAASSAPNVYRYSPSDRAIAVTIDDLATCYKQYRLRVLDLLLSKLDQLRDFSDSFRLWEQKKEDHE